MKAHEEKFQSSILYLFIHQMLKQLQASGCIIPVKETLYSLGMKLAGSELSTLGEDEEGNCCH